MSVNMLKNSPVLEKFKAKDIDVLVLNEEVDTIVFPMVTEYKEYKFVNVNDAKLDDEDKKEELEKVQKEYESFVKELKDTLGDDVKDVEVTLDLVDSPVAIKEDKDNPEYMMYMMMKQMGQTPDRPAPKPILQINPNHELIKKLKETSDQNLVADASKVLLDQAKMFAGMEIEDTLDFVTRLNRIIQKAI
jgi:molecular chaperone HtpG